MNARTSQETCLFCDAIEARPKFPSGSAPIAGYDRRACMRKQTSVGQFTVSTVFLHSDYDFTGKMGGLWYETVIFANFSGEESRPLDFMERYSTKDQALVGHARVVDRVQSGETFSMERL